MKKEEMEEKKTASDLKINGVGTECRIKQPDFLERLKNNQPDKTSENLCSCVGGCLLSPTFLSNEWRSAK